MTTTSGFLCPIYFPDYMDLYFPMPDTAYCAGWEQVWVVGDIIEFSLYFSAGVPSDLTATMRPKDAASPSVAVTPTQTLISSTVAYMRLTVPSSLQDTNVVVELTYTESGAQTVTSIPMRVLATTDADANKTIWLAYGPSKDTEANDIPISGSVQNTIRLFGEYRPGSRSNFTIGSNKDLDGDWTLNNSDLDDIFQLSIYESPDWIHKLMEHLLILDTVNIQQYGNSLSLSFIIDRDYRRGPDLYRDLYIANGSADIKLKSNKNLTNFC